MATSRIRHFFTFAVAGAAVCAVGASAPSENVYGVARQSAPVPYGAGLPPEVRKAIHQQIRIVSIRRLPDDADLIWQIRDKPESAHIVFLQWNNPDTVGAMQAAQWAVLRNWVASGGSLWIDVANLLTLGDLSRADLGVTVRNTTLSAVAVVAADGHPILTDVRRVSVTGYQFEVLAPATASILLRTPDTGLPVSCVIRHGRGVVVVLPSRFTREGLDGERFLVNLREFSAGYPVPPSAVR